MLRSRFTIKDIFVLCALLVFKALPSSSSQSTGSSASPLVYPKKNMEGCNPPCLLTARDKHHLKHLKKEFDGFRSKRSLRLILFEVSFHDQDGGLLEKRNKSIAWLKNSRDPFYSLPPGVFTLSFGTMIYGKMEVPLVYNSSTCGQKKLCRDAALYWFFVNDFKIQNETGVVLYEDENHVKRVCDLTNHGQILDCSQLYQVSWYLDAVFFANMAFVLLCAIYLSPWILVYVPHKRFQQGTDVPRLMELSSKYPVALSRLAGYIFSVPSLKSNRWADRFKVLARFLLVTPSVVYIELVLLYHKPGSYLDRRESAFYTLAWDSNPYKPKSYDIPVVSLRSDSNSDSPSPPTWHGLLSICCYFIMALGISLLPTKAIRKNICCPVCALKPIAIKDQQTDRFLSWEIRHHMNLHGVVIHKLSVPIKLVFNKFIKEITQPLNSSPLRFLKVMGCALVVIPVSLIVGTLSFTGFILAVIVLSPLCTVMFYLLRHSWHLILGLFESREKQANRFIMYGTLCLATIVVLFGNVGLLWIHIFTFAFPSKVLLFTLMGLILNADEAVPVFAFVAILAFNIYSCYMSGIEEYRKLKSILFEVCLEETNADRENASEQVENDLSTRQIVFYNKEGVPLIPEELFWQISDQILPLTERITKMVLRIVVIGILTFVIFAIVMAFSELSGFTSLAKVGAALLAGFLTKVEDVFSGGESGEELDKLRLQKEVEKLVRVYRTTERVPCNGVESVANNPYQLTATGSVSGIFDKTLIMDTQT